MVRETAKRVLDELPLVNQMAAGDRLAAQTWIERCRYQGVDGELPAADRGSEIHLHLEAWLTGGTPPTPASPIIAAQLEPYLRQLAAWVERYQPVAIAAEQVVYDPTNLFAGRFDLKAIIGGRRYVIDLKTAHNPNSTPYADKVALQLTMYGKAPLQATWKPRIHVMQGARLYLLNDAEIAQATPADPTDAGLVIHLTPESCVAYPIETTDTILAYARCIADGWRWQNIASKSALGAPI